NISGLLTRLGDRLNSLGQVPTTRVNACHRWLDAKNNPGAREKDTFHGKVRLKLGFKKITRTCSKNSSPSSPRSSKRSPTLTRFLVSLSGALFLANAHPIGNRIFPYPEIILMPEWSSR